MIQLTDATVLANNEAIGIVPNSLKYTEGLGEQSVRAASSGGGKVEQVYAADVESKFSTLKFELPSTPENIALARAWKVNNPLNVFQIVGSTSEGTVTRTFQRASVTPDYEVGIGSEENIEIEIKSDAAI